jgi:hypothetical protein
MGAGPFVQEYDVTLLSEVVVSADGATVGGHRGLDFLRGSVFLGAAAACAVRCGETFDPDFFLSGRVRFLDALPLVEGRRAFSVPLSFSRVKGEPWEGHKPLSSLTEKVDEGKQPQQWRSGYMTSEGTVVELALASRMKTAIDPETRRSDEGRLFGYQALPEGTRFRMAVHADGEEDLKRVRSWFDVAHLTLGKSRSGEYGLVRLDPVETAKPEESAPLFFEDDLMAFYLESDLALVREGVPVLFPRGDDLELFPKGAATFLPERSFLREKQFAVWNAFFNGRMEERHALARGSVLTYRVSDLSEDDAARLRARLDRGIGLYREEGWGRLCLNPSWLLAPPVLRRGHVAYAPAASPAAAPSKKDAALVTYLKYKVGNATLSEDALELGLRWAKEWKRHSDEIARDGQPVPSKSQWSALREFAVRYEGELEKLLAAMQSFCTEALRREAWEATVRTEEGARRSLRDLVKTSIEKERKSRSERVLSLALHHAAVEMGRLLAREEDPKRKGGRS